MGNGSNGLTRPFSLYGHISKEKFKQIKEFSKDKQTPFLVLDLERIKGKYDELAKNFPKVKVYYAVKANPDQRVLSELAAKGSHFDIASRFELDLVLGLGVSPDRMSYGNTIKKAEDIRYAYDKGIRLFATDSPSDIEKLAENNAAVRNDILRLQSSDNIGRELLTKENSSYRFASRRNVVEVESGGAVGALAAGVGQGQDLLGRVMTLAFSSH